MRASAWLLFTLLPPLALGCTPEVGDPALDAGRGGSGGVGGSGASSGVGGALGGSSSGSAGAAAVAGIAGAATGGTGGIAAGGGGNAGSPMGGTAGSLAGGAGGSTSGGAAGSTGGGAAGSTQAGSAGVSAGSSAGGSAGQGGVSGTSGAGGSSGGGAGGSQATTPSEGCGNGGRPSSGIATVTNDHIYTFPASYEGSDPFPLFIGFHAAGNPIDQIQDLTDGSDLETDYVRAFPKSAGNEWNYNNDIDKVLRVYDELLSTYCIDTSRIFAAGHSSGAQMIVQMLTRSDIANQLNFKAVAPVAASNYGAIMKPTAVMYIQGAMDSVRNSDGADVVARFTTANACMTSTMPYSGVASCMSSGTAVDPGCVSYQGCMLPTVWCSHDDPQYSNTNHGWPCFATDAMADFFAGLP